MNTSRYAALALLALLAFSACDKEQDQGLADIEADEALSGGQNFTTYDFSENAFGVEGRQLTGEESGLFVAGNALFRSNWVTAPASVQSLDGLGPLFNAISCGSCHFKDGRAQPPAYPDEPLNGLLFRLSTGQDAQGAPIGHPRYGTQFQDKSILSAAHEGRVRVDYVEMPGQYADGTAYSLRRPVYSFEGLNYGPLDAGILVSPRIAPQIPGLGLLENVPEADILGYADPDDADGDGISGRPNYVWDVEAQSLRLGRLGWKANQPSLRQQTAGAFNGDIGITSSLFPEQQFTPEQAALYHLTPNGGTPELSDAQLLRVTLYCQTLAVPARRDHDGQSVRRGKQVFADLGCAKCHRPSMTTGQSSPIAALNGQHIRPYTDLLLHDMGEGLADQRPDFAANGQEWRTAPLWGTGLISTVNRHQFLLHDGRARGYAEAILWHGGEAGAAKEGFRKLPAAEREALISFLESL